MRKPRIYIYILGKESERNNTVLFFYQTIFNYFINKIITTSSYRAATKTGTIGTVENGQPAWKGETFEGGIARK